ncbi:hypothetical protein CAPTEDRAFT_215202 [Capitella teleta]|uniref:Uncharacterized protein n=1 Tax=Capitella teleta TaxID=283909 RepID=R7VL96_CAPTE|nr:hypothetical protein CAPTEDRAFT_215202 [Capitella teleta]|eukprot:ELU17430.1 hypothetical protein CAPTEDRAFT_215202 [Capitella teleta]
MASMMKHQLEAHRKHVNKFAAFVQKNSNMPFTFKHKLRIVVDGHTSGVNKLYMAAMKMLLGVRTTTHNSLCQIEIGIPELKSTLQKRQGAFLRKFRQKSAGDEPLAHALNLVQ